MELIDWVSELISVPVKEYTQFEAGLSLIPVLPPEDAAALLTQRCVHIEMNIVQERSLLQLAAQHGVPRLNLIEGEYLLAMHEAELAWTRQFAETIRSGNVEGIAEWTAYHRAASEQEREHNQPPEKAEKE